MRVALPALQNEHDRGVGAATPDAADAPSNASGLYWSRRGGEVACIAHAPEPMAARWHAEQWAPMPLAAKTRHGVSYQCQHCSPSGSPINHRRLSDLAS